MKETPIDEMCVEDFSPVAIHYLGLAGCKEVLKNALNPSLSWKSFGIEYWLQKDTNNGTGRRAS